MSGICNLKFTSSDTALELWHQNGTGAVNSLGLETRFLLVRTVLPAGRICQQLESQNTSKSACELLNVSTFLIFARSTLRL